MSDPRERIETENLQCASREKAGLIEGYYRLSGFAPWPEIVAMATAILAADAEWREQNAPTLESLRAKYPHRRFGIDRPTFCDVAFYEYPGGTHYAPHYTERAALEWLAAKLAEGETDGA